MAYLQVVIEKKSEKNVNPKIWISHKRRLDYLQKAINNQNSTTDRSLIKEENDYFSSINTLRTPWFHTFSNKAGLWASVQNYAWLKVIILSTAVHIIRIVKESFCCSYSTYLIAIVHKYEISLYEGKYVSF